ncbi:MAG: hypothetical protein Kow0059_15320 [Candidatus Sumerlaeia bacterium]
MRRLSLITLSAAALAAAGLAILPAVPVPAQAEKKKTVTLEAINEPVEAVLEKISQQTGVPLEAREEVLGTIVTVRLNGAAIEEAVEAVMAGHDWVAVRNKLTGAYTLWDRKSLPDKPEDVLYAPPAAAAGPAAPSARTSTPPPPQPPPASSNTAPSPTQTSSQKPAEPMRYKEMIHSMEAASPLPDVSGSPPQLQPSSPAAPRTVMVQTTAPQPPAQPAATSAPSAPEATMPPAPTAVAPPQPASGGWENVAGGLRILRPFRNAPFPHASRQNGWTYKDETFPTDPHYTDSTVGIFLPPSFSPGADVNFIVHFHGWMNDVAGVFSQFQLAEQVAGSSVNAALLVVQGPRRARDSGGGRLEQEPGAFAALIEEVMAFLVQDGKVPAEARPGRIVLTAHSGGYRVTSYILKIGGLSDHICDVLLFDASYADCENFVNWAVGGDNRRLVSLFTDHLREENLDMMAMLSARGVRFSVIPTGRMSPDTLMGRRPIFVYVPKEDEDKGLGHNQVVSERGFYSLLLRTSALPVR